MASTEPASGESGATPVSLVGTAAAVTSSSGTAARDRFMPWRAAYTTARGHETVALGEHLDNVFARNTQISSEARGSLPSRASSAASACSAAACSLQRHADFDFPLHETPLLCVPQAGRENFEGGGSRFGELEPREEVEGLPELTTVVEPTGNRGEVLEPDSNVVRALLKDRSPFVLRKSPPS